MDNFDVLNMENLDLLNIDTTHKKKKSVKKPTPIKATAPTTKPVATAAKPKPHAAKTKAPVKTAATMVKK